MTELQQPIQPKKLNLSGFKTPEHFWSSPQEKAQGEPVHDPATLLAETDEQVGAVGEQAESVSEAEEFKLDESYVSQGRMTEGNWGKEAFEIAVLEQKESEPIIVRRYDNSYFEVLDIAPNPRDQRLYFTARDMSTQEIQHIPVKWFYAVAQEWYVKGGRQGRAALAQSDEDRLRSLLTGVGTGNTAEETVEVSDDGKQAPEPALEVETAPVAQGLVLPSEDDISASATKAAVPAGETAAPKEIPPEFYAKFNHSLSAEAFKNRLDLTAGGTAESALAFFAHGQAWLITNVSAEGVVSVKPANLTGDQDAKEVGIDDIIKFDERKFFAEEHEYEFDPAQGILTINPPDGARIVLAKNLNTVLPLPFGHLNERNAWRIGKIEVDGPNLTDDSKVKIFVFSDETARVGMVTKTLGTLKADLMKQKEQPVPAEAGV